MVKKNQKYDRRCKKFLKHSDLNVYIHFVQSWIGFKSSWRKRGVSSKEVKLVRGGPSVVALFKKLMDSLIFMRILLPRRRRFRNRCGKSPIENIISTRHPYFQKRSENTSVTSQNSLVVYRKQKIKYEYYKHSLPCFLSFTANKYSRYKVKWNLRKFAIASFMSLHFMRKFSINFFYNIDKIFTKKFDLYFIKNEMWFLQFHLSKANDEAHVN